MNIKENNGAIFLKFYGPIFSNCVSLEMLSKYNEIVFSFALLSLTADSRALSLAKHSGVFMLETLFKCFFELKILDDREYFSSS